MKYPKYWAKRLRLLGDTVAGAIAALSIAYTGMASGDLVLASLPFAAIGLLLALVVWLVLSFISCEMGGGE